jgi:hypothetical protein
MEWGTKASLSRALRFREASTGLTDFCVPQILIQKIFQHVTRDLTTEAAPDYVVRAVALRDYEEYIRNAVAIQLVDKFKVAREGNEMIGLARGDSHPEQSTAQGSRGAGLGMSFVATG